MVALKKDRNYLNILNKTVYFKLKIVYNNYIKEMEVSKCVK